MRYGTVVLAGFLLVAAVVWSAGAGEKPAPAGDDTAVLKQGQYLAQDVAHCVHCHTPHDAKGEPDKVLLLQGADMEIRPKEKTEHWADESPDITRNGLAGKWSEAEMVKFLMTGVNPKGDKPTPPMPVFHFHEDDARAVTMYLRSVPGKK
jgi:mono/diheme cytochrome c family protein